jgi:hypothetical protein
MLKDIVEARTLEGYKVYLRFEDGAQGVVDLSQFMRFEGVFAPLSDPQQFARMAVNPELGTICWFGGDDFDPDVLYAHVTGEPLPTFGEGAKI